MAYPVSSEVIKLPVFDFSWKELEKLETGTSAYLNRCKEVVHALEEYGCFMGLCDEFTPELYSDLFPCLEEMFDLPVDTKRKNVNDHIYFGYLGGLANRPLYEAMGMADPHTDEGAQHFTNTLWPAGNDPFRDTLLSFSKLIVGLRDVALKMVFDGYGVKNQDALKSNIYEVRMQKYKVAKEGEGILGASTHTDKDVMTVIVQDEINGLELETKDGQWYPVEPLPRSFIFFSGEALMAWSNDRIRAAPHRVMMRQTNKSRITVGLFSFFSGITKIPEEFIDEQHPPLYKPFVNLDLMKYYATPEGNKRRLYTIKGMCGVH